MNVCGVAEWASTVFGGHAQDADINLNPHKSALGALLMYDKYVSPEPSFLVPCSNTMLMFNLH